MVSLIRTCPQNPQFFSDGFPKGLYPVSQQYFFSEFFTYKRYCDIMLCNKIKNLQSELRDGLLLTEVIESGKPSEKKLRILRTWHKRWVGTGFKT